MLSLGNKYYILLLLYIITIIRQKTAILKNYKVTTYVYKSGLLMRCNLFRTPFWYASVQYTAVCVAPLHHATASLRSKPVSRATAVSCLMLYDMCGFIAESWRD